MSINFLSSIDILFASHLSTEDSAECDFFLCFFSLSFLYPWCCFSYNNLCLLCYAFSFFSLSSRFVELYELCVCVLNFCHKSNFSVCEQPLYTIYNLFCRRCESRSKKKKMRSLHIRTGWSTQAKRDWICKQFLDFYFMIDLILNLWLFIFHLIYTLYTLNLRSCHITE